MVWFIAIGLQLKQSFKWARAVIKAGTAALLVGLVLVCSLLSSAPGWHERLHLDAGQEGHHCAITFFAQGQIEGPGPQLRWDPIRPEYPGPILFVRDTFSSAPDFFLLPSCGPPALPA